MDELLCKVFFLFLETHDEIEMHVTILKDCLLA